MDIIMPQLGETVAEGEILLWHKAEGDVVKKGDALFEISTDKVAMEVPAMENGVLTKIIANVGEVIPVGEPVALLAAEGDELVFEGKETALASSGGLSRAVQAEAEMLKPMLSDEVNVRLIASKHRLQGGNGLFSPAVKYLAAKYKVDLSVIAGRGYDGRITKRDMQAHIQQISTRLNQDAFRDQEALALEDDVLAQLSPSVRRLVTEHGVNINHLDGTGRYGRITESDVLSYLDGDAALASRATQASQTSPVSSLPILIKGKAVAFTLMRKQIARQMASSVQNAVHVAQGMEVSFDAVEDVRQANKMAFKKRYGCSLTPLAFVARAVVKALQAFPHLNGQVGADKLVLSVPIHLGIAVDLSHQGLVVPVIKHADTMNVLGLARQIAELATKARENRLTPDDMSGATYTLSNNGGSGTAFTTPIINHPEIAILSIDSIVRKPVVVNVNGRETLGIGSVGMLVQSFDHRAVDGAYSGAFLQQVKSMIESHDWQGEL
ncbi:2-oxo acid dehydrogenase subunit E2 [Enterovibrio sp. ZSDZ42]|uniref:Dihydrolipoamide acetyltransferase component of pyruvate dehydrogenase complex n=1 Tax=Enterovibrio gelatinilyticus TaxID=2899819 RepID=A0ABT5QZH2_9GAMM|nr:2-oxo acid dehydrogenase subunit E2 [Enterovibrio sp. ZSDZ42]MDD1793413.1 2-oxo acid dehydrogenase subunit E2 [Enterovibrio sp. ZSDZ42]